MAPLAHKPIFVEASVGLKIDRTCSHLQPLVHKVFLSSHKLTAVAGKNSHSILLDVFYKPHYSSSYKICIKPCLHHFRKRSTKVRSLYGSDDGVVGDSKLQQVLVDMVRIQVGKVRMIEFVDERSQYLRNIADEATFEYDQIAYRTMKGLDATGSRVLRQLDADANAIVQDLIVARAELEAQSRDFEEFQIRIAYSRNEGLFFKNLYRSPQAWRHHGGLSKKKIEEKVALVAMESGQEFGPGYQQLLYGGLSLVMVSFIWSSSSALMAGACMRVSKLASYGVIFSLLLAQLAYIKVITEEESDGVLGMNSHLTKDEVDGEVNDSQG